MWRRSHQISTSSRTCLTGFETRVREGLSGFFLKIMTDTPHPPLHPLPHPATFCLLLLPHSGCREFAGVARLAGIWGTGNPSMVVPQLVGKATEEGIGCLWKKHWPWGHQTWSGIKALLLTAWLTYFS